MLDDNNKFPDINPNRSSNNSNKKANPENFKKLKIFNTAVENFYCDSQTKTKDFFLRKTENNFIKKTLYSIKRNSVARYNKKSEFADEILFNSMKTDLIDIDEMIKSNSNISSVINTGKIFKLNPHFQNKLNEINIGSKIEITSFFKEIEENSQNFENLCKEFKSSSEEELILRLSTELYYNRLFINKIDNLAFLFNFAQNDTNAQNFKENLSKFNQLRILLKNLKEKNSSPDIDSNSLMNLSNSYIHKENSNSKDNTNLSRILEFNSLTEIFNFDSDDLIINHIKFLFSNFCEKSLNIFADLIIQISSNESNAKENKFENKNFNFKNKKAEDTVENFIIIRKYIEDVLEEKQNTLNDIKISLMKIKNENENLNRKKKEKSENNSLELFSKIQEESKLFLIKLDKKFFESIKDLLENKKIKIDESKKFNIELEATKNKNQTLTTELSFREKQISILKDKSKTPLEIEESYERVLQDQYTTMKESFISKLNFLTNEFSKYQLNTTRTIAILEEELKIFKKSRELFVNHLIEAKKKLNSG